MDKSSQGRGRIRLVPVVSEQRSRAERDVRWSRVRAARARIAAGFYERDDVREKLLDAILAQVTER